MSETATSSTPASDGFPRRSARTQQFTLGEPRTITVSPDGLRVVFLRSRRGDDAATCLWVLDLATATERLVADPRELLTLYTDLAPDERARRERVRERAEGITSYATDTAVRVATFTLGDRLFTAGLISGGSRRLDVPGPVFDPRPDPTASRLAYVRENALVVAALDGSTTVIASDDDENVSWGRAEFVAAEEMGRFR